MTNKGRDGGIRDPSGAVGIIGHSGAEGVRSHRGTDGSKGLRWSSGLRGLSFSKRVKVLKTPFQRLSYFGDQEATVVLVEPEG